MNSNLEHFKWYWLDLDGPDGRIRVLGRYQSRFPEGFFIPDDGETFWEVFWSDKRVHKWSIIRISEVISLDDRDTNSASSFFDWTL